MIDAEAANLIAWSYTPSIVTPVQAPPPRLYCLEDEINAQAIAMASELATMAPREKIEALHQAIVDAPDVPIETRHYYANGLYAREIVVPAGTWVVGAIHSDSHINVLSKGRASVATEAGGRMIEAPATFEAPAGRRVVGFAHTECVWTTFRANPTNERDPDELFKLMTLDDYPDAPRMIEGAN